MAGPFFESTTSRFTILNPFNNFAVEEHMVEVRKDPLLGDTSVYNPFLKDKATAFFQKTDADLIRKLAADTEDNCIFCPENVSTKTAMYPPEIIPEGRIKVGEAVLFANAFSVGQYHPVVTVSKAHFLRPSEFTSAMLADAFTAARMFLVSVSKMDPSAAYVTVNSNYLLPAGASLVHPHLQMLATPLPYSYHARLLSAAEAYYKANGSSYFEDLVSEERRAASRYIGTVGGWHWLAAFSPMGSNEIIAIHDKETDFGAMSQADLTDLSYGITKVLALYEGLGHMSFNYSLFSVSKCVQAPGFRSIFKMVSRQNLYANYRNDDYFLQKLLQSELIFNLPEELAERLRGMF